MYKLVASIVSITISSFNFLFVPLFKANAKIFEIPISNKTIDNVNKSYNDIKGTFKTVNIFSMILN